MTHFTQPSAIAPLHEASPTQNSAKECLQSIKSYVRRQGKITVGQKRALLTLSKRWIWHFAGAPLAMGSIFERPAPIVLEIGFGMGETTAQIALAHPETNFLAVEVYDAGVGSLMQRAEKSGLTNLKIIQHDAVAVVRDGIAANLLAGVHIFFPDPWPKKRHHKRRLLQAEFVDLIVSRLAPGGYLHVATDWPDYAAQILGLLSAHPELRNTNVYGGFSPRPDTRPLTKFEQRGIRLGNPVADLIFTRQIKN
ncbi:MAG: tRNA (guanosine(46)-N7)-methyltransferase TrmB [Burkholderiaceae bacterium]